MDQSNLYADNKDLSHTAVWARPAQNGRVGIAHGCTQVHPPLF